MPDRAAALAALRAELDGARFGDAAVLEVTDGGGDGFLVEVRQARRRATHVIVVPADDAALATDLFTGEVLGDAEEWATFVLYWLMEELDLGLVWSGARTTLADGSVAIDPRAPRTVRPGTWRIDDVPLERPTAAAERKLRRAARRSRRRWLVVIGDDVAHEPDPTPGAFLVDAGLEVGPARRCHDAGRLIAWYVLRSDESHAARSLGHAVVAWGEEGTTARLDHLEAVDATPEAAAADLVRLVVHTAADAGARWLDVPAGATLPDDLGAEVIDRDGGRRVDLMTLP